MYVKAIASETWDIFRDTVYTVFLMFVSITNIFCPHK